MYAAFRSIGAYLPKNVLSNSDLEKMIDTTDEWITKRTGIKERRIADSNEYTSDLGANAGKIAIERASLKPEDIDLILCATISPDYLCMPSTACLIADKLKIYNVPAFDISAACSGFVYGLQMAKSFIESGTYKNILLIGAEKLSSIVNYKDRGTCILFGDGAGAAVISATDNKEKAILDIHISSDGKYQDLLITPGCGSKNPCSKDVLENSLAYMQMKGNETFKIAVRTLTNDVKNILAKNNLTSTDIDFFVPHQANYRIINAVAKELKFQEKQNVLTVHKYGNTSASSIPIAINDIYESGKLKNGDMMLVDTFGGGLTWGSGLVIFDGN